MSKDWQGAPHRRARLLAAGFAFDMAVLEIEDEEERDKAKPYVLAGQRFSYADAIDVLKMERMFFKLPAHERRVRG